METHVLIAAAGTGSRLGGELPKQYQNIAGKPILRHTLDNMLQIQGISSVRVIIHPDHVQYYDDAVAGLDLPAPIIGGGTRKISIYNGLNSFVKVKNDFKILIHDAARPFFNPKIVQDLIEKLDKGPAATLATSVSDTIRHENGEFIDRNGLWAVQTPQGFHYQTLLKAHETFKNRDDFTDDTVLIREMGGEVAIIPSSRMNYKITTQDDMAMAKALLAENTEIRTGQGFDVHAFEDGEAESTMICGVAVPYKKRLKGHSDADVGLHAATDAILGAVGAGDIGQHFPPSDNQWKDADSAVFLSEAMRMVEVRGGMLINLDITIICEEPKIGPHRESMRQRVAEITGVEQSRINIKATTTEQLGFIGRGEGVAAQAIANIRLPMAD